jgi:dGTPase
MDWRRLLSPIRLRELMKEQSVSPPYSDFRTTYEQDWGRAVFCTPTRRLQDKAQVFPLETIDAVRTRLTHSLEVSSVARSITRKAVRRVRDRWLTDDRQYAIETVAATCGLLHDSGNPPFGHFGETAVKAWFRGSKLPSQMPEQYAKDLENFEGNAQTIRLVSKLQILADFRGLNLTAATMSALLKYTASSGEIDSSKSARQSRKKLGYFQAEAEEISRVRQVTGTRRSRNPITMLVEASDDLVYLTVDLEDAIKKGVVRWDEFEEFARPYGKKPFSKVDRFEKACRSLHKGAALSEAKAQYFRTTAIRMGAEAVVDCFTENYRRIMKGEWDQELLYVSRKAKFFSKIKEFSIKNIYSAKETVRLEILGYNIMHDLLDLFSLAERDPKPKTFERKLYDMMSKNYRAVYEKALKDDLPPAYCKALLLTDYICGMTDSFAVRLHRDLKQGKL